MDPKTQDGSVWTRLIWLRIRTSCGLLSICNEPSGSRLASQWGLGSAYLVTQLLKVSYGEVNLPRYYWKHFLTQNSWLHFTNHGHTQAGGHLIPISYSSNCRFYRQPVRLGVKRLETQDRRTPPPQTPCGHSPYVTSSLTRIWVCLLCIAWPFVKCTYRTYHMLLKIIPFALQTSPLSGQALQIRTCLSYVSYVITAA
jgi:hypothetical protein